MKKTIAILHPGEMGTAIGACLISKGHRVVWASTGRGGQTRMRAKDAGFEDAGTMAHALKSADIALSVCPPHAAVELASEVSGCRFRGIYVDANAISPATTRRIATMLELVHADFVDGGIIGPPPIPGASTRLYLSGGRAAEVAALFEGSLLHAIAMEGPVGAASALKVCFAAWNKGATALLAGVRALAEHEGVDAALLAEWKISLPDTAKRSEVVTVSARKAWRWIAEMEEIAASFEAAGLPGGFHQASAEIYRRLEGFKGAGKTPTLAEVTAVLNAHRA